MGLKATLCQILRSQEKVAALSLPHSNQSARVGLQRGLNHSQSLMTSNFAIL